MSQRRPQQTWKVMGRAVACRTGLLGCSGEAPRGVKAAAMGVRASLKPPGTRSAVTQVHWSSRKQRLNSARLLSHDHLGRLAACAV